MNRESIENYNDEKIIAISKKHWVSNVIPVFCILAGLQLLLAGHYIIGLILILISVIKILANKSVCWLLTSEDLIIKSGLLWYKGSFEIPKEDIFEALYKKSLLGNLFGYRTIAIRRTDGVTTSFLSKTMENGEEITKEINYLVRELKKNPKTNTININQAIMSMADELNKLNELKIKGLITEDEFNIQKNKLIK